MNQHNGIEAPAEESTTANLEHGDILVDFERPLGPIKPLHGVSHSPEKDGIYVCAARSDDAKAVMLVNRARHEQTVAFSCRGVEGRPTSCLLTDHAARYNESRTWEADGKLTLRAESVMVLRYA